MKNGKGNGKERPGDAMLELASEIARDDGEWDDWEESTVRTLIVDHRHQPPPPREKEPSMAGVAHAAVQKLPPSHLLIVVLVVAVAAALVAGRKLGLW